MSKENRDKETKAETASQVNALVMRILDGGEISWDSKEFDILQKAQPKNRQMHLSFLERGDIVEPIADVSWATSGNSVVIEVTDEEIVLSDGDRYSAKTGRSLQKPWGYHL